MSDENKSELGVIGWVDLTVPNATEVRDFYSQVVGWVPSPVDMGSYEDFNMSAGGKPVAGVCHARDANAEIPNQWMLYIVVEDLDRSLERCQELGGKILGEPRRMSSSSFCIIQDPGGAVCALYQPS